MKARNVSSKTKQLLIQTIRDLNQKRKSLVKTFETARQDSSAQWLKDSRVS